MKRTVATVKQYDYSSMKEFEKHKSEMIEKGYHFIENNGSSLSMAFNHGTLNDEKWVYTASYIKSDMM